MEEKIPFTDIEHNKAILARVNGLLKTRPWLKRFLGDDSFSEPEIRNALSELGFSFTGSVNSARFYLEDPKQFQDAKWNFARRPNGGYGTPLWYKEGPEYFEFLKRFDGRYVTFESSEIQHKQEWSENQGIIETMHVQEAKELVKRGYNLVNTYEASVPNEDGDHDLGFSYSDRRIYVLVKGGLEKLAFAQV